MICQTCHGKGYTSEVTEDQLGVVMIVLPCKECIGGVSQPTRIHEFKEGKNKNEMSNLSRQKGN